MKDFDILLDQVSKLKSLLEHPEPGLVSWCIFVGQHWKCISDMWISENKSQIYTFQLEPFEGD